MKKVTTDGYLRMATRVTDVGRGVAEETGSHVVARVVGAILLLFRERQNEGSSPGLRILQHGRIHRACILAFASEHYPLPLWPMRETSNNGSDFDFGNLEQF